MITRRRLLIFVGLSAPGLRQLVAGAHNAFWNTKDPADWNEKETSEILTRSPWAKHAIVDSGADSSMSDRDSSVAGRPAAAGGSWGGGSGGMGGGGMGGAGGMGGGGNMGAPGGGSSPGQIGGMSGQARGGDSGTVRDGMPPKPQFDVLVRWESALPVSAALKKPAPAEAAKSYIISVSGLPLHPPASHISEADRRAGIEEAFKQATTLQRKGKDPILPDHVELAEQAGASSLLRFTFPHDPHPITADDKEVIFLTSLGRTSIRAKFAPKEMIYRDQLTL